MSGLVRRLDDRVVDLATAAVARAALRHGMGKYRLLCHVYLCVAAVFVAAAGICACTMLDRPAAAAAGFAFVGLLAVVPLLGFRECAAKDALSGRPGFAEADAAEASHARSHHLVIRLLFAFGTAFQFALALLPGTGSGICAMMGAAMAVRTFSEYLRCVPQVPPRRTEGSPERRGRKAGSLAAASFGDRG